MVDFYLPIVDQVQACEMDESCLSSPEFKGEGGSLCQRCKWSPANPEGGLDLYRLAKGNRVRFKRREEAERAEGRARVASRATAHASIDKSRTRLGKRAATAEKRTQKSLVASGVRATVNSGRTHKDGDHNFAGRISLDTKLQTGNINPVVNMAELAKIQADARRAGNPVGVLVLRNKLNQGVVAVSEADWATILGWLSSE